VGSVLRQLAAVAAVVLIFASGCSSSSAVDESSQPSEITSCQAAADQVVSRFDEFLEPYSDQTPEEFLGASDLDGLDDFQNDVAQIIVDVATDPNDDCTEFDLEGQVDDALAEYANEGLLNQYLVGFVRQGVAIETRDIMVTPDDDLAQLLPLLGPGSTVTLEAGTYDLSATIIVQSELTLLGAGRESTLIQSDAPAAAFAAANGGALTMQDLTVRHIGSEPASVVLAVDAILQLSEVTIAGGKTDLEDAGGSGVVLTSSAAASSSSFENVRVADNQAAGIVLTGTAEMIAQSIDLDRNGQCGICFFDDASGEIRDSRFEANALGMQVNDQASPFVIRSSFIESAVAGVVINGSGEPRILQSEFGGPGEAAAPEGVAIDVQGTGLVLIGDNRFDAHAVAISVRGSSTANLTSNVVDGGEVGIAIGERGEVSGTDNRVTDTTVSAVLVSDMASGELTRLSVDPADGAGLVAEGSSIAKVLESEITGGVVGAVFRDASSGQIENSMVSGQPVGIEIADSAMPTIALTTVQASGEAGILLTGSGAPIIRENTLMVDQIGIQAGGASAAWIRDNQLDGGDTAILATDATTAKINGNTFNNQNFGIGVSDSAAPEIGRNEIIGAVAAAISFEDTTAGVVSNNRILDAGVAGIRVGGDASPTIENNVIFAATPDPVDSSVSVEQPAEPNSDSGAGILYAESSSGIADSNELFGFIIGIQVSDQAAPQLDQNQVDGAGIGGVGILYGVEGAGEADGNTVRGNQLGFQFSGSAEPQLQRNVVEDALAAAFLIQEGARPLLSQNQCGQTPADIVILGDADPAVADNECAVARG